MLQSFIETSIAALDTSFELQLNNVICHGPCIEIHECSLVRIEIWVRQNVNQKLTNERIHVFCRKLIIAFSNHER